jgi:hypothetical protein
VLPRPTARDRKIESGLVLGRIFQVVEKRPVDQLDEDAAILFGLDSGSAQGKNFMAPYSVVRYGLSKTIRKARSARINASDYEVLRD